jgi:uncharacterized protein YjbI with pentapeptide repeats
MSKFLVVIFLRLVWRGPIFPNAALVKSNLDYADDLRRARLIEAVLTQADLERAERGTSLSQ